MLVRRRGWFWPRAKAERRVALLELQREAGHELPEAYLRLVWRGRGDPARLRVPPGTCVLWPAEEVLALNQHFDVGDAYPGLFGFGSDGAQALLAFDTRTGPPFPVVSVPFIGLESEIRLVAADFEAFLRLMG